MGGRFGGTVDGCWVVACVGAYAGSVVGSNNTIHIPVHVHLRPCIITFPLYLTLTSILVKVRLHPSSQSVTAEMSECEAGPGMMCPTCVRAGSWDKSKRH